MDSDRLHDGKADRMFSMGVCAPPHTPPPIAVRGSRCGSSARVWGGANGSKQIGIGPLCSCGPLIHKFEPFWSVIGSPALLTGAVHLAAIFFAKLKNVTQGLALLQVFAAHLFQTEKARTPPFASSRLARSEVKGSEADFHFVRAKTRYELLIFRFWGRK